MRFLDVTESSGTDAVPLYGAPSYFTTGMDFDPTSFSADSTNGDNDITDGQLNFTIAGEASGSQIEAIDTLNLFEAGDYGLAGVGTPATQALAGLIARVLVTEINGVAPAGGPIMLTPSSASVGFNLTTNPGVVQPWSLGMSVDIKSQLMAMGYSASDGATEVEVVVDNRLIALSEPNSAASIAKKEFQATLETSEVALIPEPAAVSVLALGVAGALMRRRGR